MGQVTIYLDEETEKKMVTNARAMKLSKSKWIANAIREKLRDEWPATVRELPGSWPDFPSLDELRANRDAGESQRASPTTKRAAISNTRR